MGLRKLLWATLTSISMLAACGDDDVVCGAGTEERDGSCVPDDDGGTAGGGAGSGGTAGGLSCGDGTTAVDGECVAVDAGSAGSGGESAAPLPVGAACELPADCESQTCQISEQLPGGYCTVVGCNADNPCPVGSTCYQSYTGITLCMAFCEGDVDCREDEGYNCQPLYTNGLGICAPSCTASGACTSGTRCNEETGLCELTNCDPTASESSCEDEETCYPDTRGLTEDGGLCLRLCDPADVAATCLPYKEVCQPLADDPANVGFCAPPVCSATHECPAGAICRGSVCQPPALCDDDNPCEDDLLCVSGKCLSPCPTGDDTCADIHPGLVCADVLAEPACLPLGAFPGSACRPNRDDACSAVTAGDGSAAMICQDDTCLVDCTTGGTELCQSVSDTLVCATGVFETAVCLPKGAFPGGPCGAGDTCAADLQGNPDVDMVCRNATCVIDCNETTKWEGFGDAMCQIVSPALTCSETAGNVCVRACAAGACGDGYSCFDAGAIPVKENACLPNGSFPGSACATGDLCAENIGGIDEADMVCVNGTCVVNCNTAGSATLDDLLCEEVSDLLTCAESAGNLCVLACDDTTGACPTGYSCLDAGGQNACLPNGSFPGSACAAGNTCAQNLGNVAEADMVCIAGTCIIECDTPGDAAADDGLCAALSGGVLTCSESAGNLCVRSCATVACGTGFSCLDVNNEDACLPTGSFPGSPCRATVGNECDQNLRGVDEADMVCVGGACIVECVTPGDAAADDALCAGVSPVLTCGEASGNYCWPACASGVCPNGFICNGADNACVPD